MANKYLDSDGVLYFWQKIKALLSNKVDKVSGKDLSTNDYTTAEKTKLSGIAAGANNYTLPTATSSTLGGVKTTSTVTSSSGYTAVPIISGVPYYKDTNTTYTAATLAADGLMTKEDKAALNGAAPVSKFFGQDGVECNRLYDGSTDELDRIIISGTQATTSKMGMMTAADKTKLDGIATGANKYTLPTASGSTLGGVKTTSTVTSTSGYTAAPIISGVPYYKNTTYSSMTAATTDAAGKAGLVPAPAAGKQTSFLRGDGTWVVPANTTYSNMTAATATAAGKAGLVPAPAAGKQASFLRGDGTWVVPANTTYAVATTSANGLMSKEDKAKLNAFGAASTYALKSDITNMYKYKGSVAAVANLPASGNTAGDVYNVEANGMNYAWNGTAWDALGEIFSITSITNAEIDTIVAS